MAAGTICVTKTLDRINVIVAAVSGIQAVYQGYKRFTDAQNFYDIVGAGTSESNGWFYFWLKSSGHAFKLDTMPTFEVVGELLVPVVKNTSTDLNTAVQLAEAVKDALLLNTNWPVGNGYVGPQFISYEFDGVSISEAGIGVASFGFGNEGKGSMIFMGGC